MPKPCCLRSLLELRLQLADTLLNISGKQTKRETEREAKTEAQPETEAETETDSNRQKQTEQAETVRAETERQRLPPHWSPRPRSVRVTVRCSHGGVSPGLAARPARSHRAPLARDRHGCRLLRLL